MCIRDRVEAGEYDILKYLLSIKVKHNPQDAAARRDLAAAYHQAGDSTTALKILREAKADIPEYAELLDKVIGDMEAGSSVANYKTDPSD